MKRFYAYIRVSTVKQGEHGISLQEQRSAIETYAQRHDLGIVEWFEEMETAAKRGRPMFSKMLAQLRRGQVDGVIIHKIDRSARNLKDWSDIGELIDRGIDVRFAHESLDMQSRGGRLTADIQAVIAADYIRNLRDEVKKGFYGRLKQGFYPLPAPLGYLDQGNAKVKVPDPVRAPLIRQAFELYAEGNHSIRTLTEEINRRGLRTRRNGSIRPSTLGDILHNPFYMGLIHIKRTKETFQGQHEPLISTDLYQRTQSAFRQKTFARTRKHSFLFRRMIRCVACDRLLIAESQKGHVYYRCHRCPGTILREEVFEEFVAEVLLSIRLTDEELGDLVEEAANLHREHVATGKAQQNSAKMAAAQVDERLARLTDALIDGLIEKSVFDLRNTQLLHERRALIDRIEKEDCVTPLPEKVSRLLELTQTAYLLYENGSPDEKRNLIKSVSSNLSLERKNPEIKLFSPYQEIANRHADRTGGPYREMNRTFLKKLLEILEDGA